MSDWGDEELVLIDDYRDRRPADQRQANTERETTMNVEANTKESDKAYFARLNEAAHRVMDFFGSDETRDPDYIRGFEYGFTMAFHTLQTSCDVFTFWGSEGANRLYDDGFRDALAHLGCTWIGDPIG